MLLRRRLEGLQGLALPGAELLRDLQQQAIAGVAVAALAQPRHPLAAQAQHLVRLAAGGDFQRVRTVEHGHLDLGAERQLGERYGQVAEQIGAVAREDRVVADPHEDVEIAGGAAVHAAAALAGQAQLHAVVDAGRDLDAQDVVAAQPSLAPTVLARALVDLALAAAARTRARHREKAVAHADLAAALARVARRLLRARLAAAALARLAALEPRDLDLRVQPGRGVLERDLQLVLEVLAAHRARAASPPAAALAASSSGAAATATIAGRSTRPCSR